MMARLENKFRKEPSKFELDFILMVQQFHKDILAANHVKSETVKEVNTKATKPKVKKTSSTVHLKDGCSDHPNYGAVRPPKTNCSGCWDAYKKYNPTKCDAAWLKFSRKQTNLAITKSV